MGRSGARSPTPTPTLRATHLVLEQQHHALKQLVAVNGGERKVKEEAVEHRLGDPL